MNQDYDSIRPYSDQETSIALKRVADAPELSAISAFLFGPGEAGKRLSEPLSAR